MCIFVVYTACYIILQETALFIYKQLFDSEPNINFYITIWSFYELASNAYWHIIHHNSKVTLSLWKQTA